MREMTGRRMVLAVDATVAVGAGHAMRVLTLAAAWRALGGDAVAVGRIDLPFVARRFQDLGVAVQPGTAPVGDVLVVDRYDAEHRRMLGAGNGSGLKVLVDDLADDVPAGYDLVWNPNPYASAAHYPGFGGRVLAGSAFVAIREGLPKWQKKLDGDVVVTLGGGVPDRAMIRSFGLLAELMPAERIAIAGHWAPAGCRAVSPDQLWVEAGAGKCLVTAAGGTAWEAAAVGVPIVVVAIADNQRLAFQWARASGVPGADAQSINSEGLAHQLRALIPAAMIAPALANGAGRVAAELARLVTSGRAA